MKTYPQQHEPWWPYYPPVWNDICFTDDGDFDSFDRLEPLSSLPALRDFNMLAFTTARNAIDKAMRQ